MKINRIKLKQAETGKLSDAEIWHDITPKNTSDFRDHWIPEISSDEEYHDWDWEQKVSDIENETDYLKFSIVCRNMTQGMMILNLGVNSIKFSDKKLVYIDYLQVAPWNEHTNINRKFLGLGVILFNIAKDVSNAHDYEGRIGLVSLPGSEPFYKKMGMSKINPEQSSSDMFSYFEL